MTDPIVRIATLADGGELLSLLREWHSEEGAAPLDQERAAWMLRIILDGHGVIGVIGDPGHIEASICLYPSRLWYSAQPTLECLWSYVLPAFRKSANGKALALFAKRQSAKLGIPLVLEVSTGTTEKFKLYERLFGARGGTMFHWQPEGQIDTHFRGPPVRTAHRNDLDEIVSVCRELHGENGAFQSVDELAIPVIEATLAGDGVIGIIGDPGHIEGTICFRVSSLWYSSSPMLEEMWAYIRPGFRSSNNAKNLICFAMRQASRLGIPLHIGVASKIELEQKVRLYQRLLGKPSAQHFLYEPGISA
jgi:hypothetical protein